MGRRFRTFGGIALAVVVAVAGWRLLTPKRAQSQPFLTAPVERGTVIQHVTATGTLTAVTTVKVGSQVSGIIATLHADFNDRVRRGEILATLDPTPFEAVVNQTRAQLDGARVAAQDANAKYRRQQALYAAQLTSEDQLESAKAANDQADAQVTELQAALDRAQANLTYSIIRSPIDGVVVSRDYDVGQTVAASFQAPTLFTIAEDLTRMQLTCDVDEADIGQVKVGQTVRFSVDSYPEREFTGEVAQIRLSPSTTNNVVTYPVIVDVPNADLKLLPGMTAEVRIEVARAEGVLRVPASALRFRPELLGLSAVGERPRAGHAGSAAGSGPGRSQAGGQASQGFPPAAATARVFLAPAATGAPLRAVDFVPGLTDGQFVEVRRGEIREGERIVVGLATTQSSEIGGLAGMTPFGRRR